MLTTITFVHSWLQNASLGANFDILY